MSYLELRPVSTAPGLVTVERIERDGQTADVRSSGDVEDVRGMLVATRDMVVSYKPTEGAAWEIDEIRSGITRIAPDHEYARAYPDLWEPFGMHEARARVARSEPAPRRQTMPAPVERELVVRERAERPAVVHLTRAAFTTMKFAVQDHDSVECGGALLGPRRMSFAKEWLVDDAVETGRDNAPDSVMLRSADLEACETPHTDSYLLGSWHSHPTFGRTEPSQADIEHWRHILERGEERHDIHRAFGLIITPGERHWSTPVIHAWSVRLEPTSDLSERIIIEPAEVSVRR